MPTIAGFSVKESVGGEICGQRMRAAALEVAS